MTEKGHISGRVLKVLGLFTGSEMVKILCSIIKMKLVAMWLHAAGVGLFGILNTTADTIYIISGLGLRQSGVKAVADAENKSRQLLHSVISAVRTWGWIAGLIGAVALSALAIPLSLFFFGEISQWWMFIILSAALLLNALIDAELVVMQGNGMFKAMTKASIAGSVGGLAISIPMFRFWGEVSVPASIVTYSLCSLVFLMIFRHKDFDGCRPSRKVVKEGKSFARMGGIIAVASFISNLAQMAFLAYLNREGSESTVGYYQAGSTLVLRYFTIIFSSIIMEFYPRMSKIAGSRSRSSIFLSHEISLLISILMPLLFLFLIFKSLIVRILYTPDFMVILPFITIAVLTVVFRCISYCFGVCILARADGKAYIITESIDAAIGLMLSIGFYHYMGLTGVGLALVIWYVIYMIMSGLVCLIKYKLHITASTWLMILGSIILGIMAVGVSYTYSSNWVVVALIVGILGYIPALSALFRGHRRSLFHSNRSS